MRVFGCLGLRVFEILGFRGFQAGSIRGFIYKGVDSPPYSYSLSLYSFASAPFVRSVFAKVSQVLTAVCSNSDVSSAS